MHQYSKWRRMTGYDHLWLGGWAPHKCQEGTCQTNQIPLGLQGDDIITVFRNLRLWEHLVYALPESHSCWLLLSLQILSFLFCLLHKNKGNFYEVIQNLNTTHDRKAGEESQCSANDWNLHHSVCLSILRDVIKGWGVEVDIDNMQLQLRLPSWWETFYLMKWKYMDEQVISWPST